MTKIKALIAAIDAEQLAAEATKRESLISKNKLSRDEVYGLVNKALEKQPTQAQLKQALLKQKWRPPGYISVLELLDLAESYKFKEWSGHELEVLANPPKCLQVSDALDLKNTAELIAYALSHGFIKEGIQQPPCISGKNPGVWQSPWLYLHRMGKFNGAKTKEDAIDGWLEEVSFIVPENSQHNSALHKVEELKKFLRNALCMGKIKAARLGSDGLEDVVHSYWLGNDGANEFDIQNPSFDLLFEQASAKKFLEKCDFSGAKKPSTGNRGRKKGDGTYNDSVFLKQMKALMDARDSKSAQDASITVVNKYENLDGGPKGQSRDAIIDRLARKFRKQEKNSGV